MFSCDICEIFKNTYFEEHLETTASHLSWNTMTFSYNTEGNDVEPITPLKKHGFVLFLIVNFRQQLETYLFYVTFQTSSSWSHYCLFRSVDKFMQENPAIRTSFDKLNKKNLLNSDKDQLELAQFRILQNNIVYSNIVYCVKTLILTYILTLTLILTLT